MSEIETTKDGISLVKIGVGRTQSGEYSKFEVDMGPWTIIAYTDEQTARLSRKYIPAIVGDVVGRAEVEGLEEVLHPLVSMSRAFERFAGFPESEMNKLVEYSNFFLDESRKNLITTNDPQLLAQAVENGYVRVENMEGGNVYFATEKTIEQMCETPANKVDYALGLYTGVLLNRKRKRSEEHTS